MRSCSWTPWPHIWACAGEILRCPWHGWELGITTGHSIFNPHRMRVGTYEVTVEPGVEEDERETHPVTVEDGLVSLHA